MRTFAKVAIRVVFILSVIVLFFGVAVPQVLGMGWPQALGRSTRPVHVFRLVNIMPGDTFSKTLRFHNYGSSPLHYRLVFVRSGDLWECDAGGYNLHYEMTWSPGANQYLKPGETEQVMVTVTFPQAASNACQGKVGLLTVRRSYLNGEEGGGAGGIYECRPSPYAHSSSKGLLNSDDLNGCICGKVGRPFLDLLYP